MPDARAGKGDLALIPFNMRDGCVVARGRGNADWNRSAPRGPGRALSRSECSKTPDMEEYRDQTRGVFSASVRAAMIDESPMACKRKDDIMRVLPGTVDALKVLRPAQNFTSAKETDWKRRGRKSGSRGRVSFPPAEQSSVPKRDGGEGTPRGRPAELQDRRAK